MPLSERRGGAYSAVLGRFQVGTAKCYGCLSVPRLYQDGPMATARKGNTRLPDRSVSFPPRTRKFLRKERGGVGPSTLSAPLPLPAWPSCPAEDPGCRSVFGQSSEAEVRELLDGLCSLSRLVAPRPLLPGNWISRHPSSEMRRIDGAHTRLHYGPGSLLNLLREQRKWRWCGLWAFSVPYSLRCCLLTPRRLYSQGEKLSWPSRNGGETALSLLSGARNARDQR